MRDTFSESAERVATLEGVLPMPICVCILESSDVAMSQAVNLAFLCLGFGVSVFSSERLDLPGHGFRLRALNDLLLNSDLGQLLRAHPSPPSLNPQLL